MVAAGFLDPRQKDGNIRAFSRRCSYADGISAFLAGQIRARPPARQPSARLIIRKITARLTKIGANIVTGSHSAMDYMQSRKRDTAELAGTRLAMAGHALGSGTIVPPEDIHSRPAQQIENVFGMTGDLAVETVAPLDWILASCE